MKQLNDDISKCSSSSLSHISIQNTDINGYYSNNKHIVGTFDYIEYNGGINANTNDDVDAHLIIFEKLLVSDGVLGLTFFATNVHTDTILAMLNNIYTNTNSNTNAKIINADQARKLMVQYYLESCNYHAYANDNELITFLSNIGINDIKTISMTRRQADVINLLNSNGYNVQAWIPTAYSNPFDELQDYKIYQYQAFGISQEAFVEEILITFRKTIYATKLKPMNSHLGRANLTDRPNSPISTAKSYTVVDRFKGVKEIGKIAAARAVNGLSTEITFNLHTLEKVNVTTILMPSAAKAISKIGYDEYTLDDIIKVDNNAEFSRQHVISMLSYLEKMNYITIIKK